MDTYKGYQFEVEKYLEQMTYNPYLEELRQSILEDKRKKLRTYVPNTLVDSMSEDLLDFIIIHFKTHESLTFLKNKLSMMGVVSIEDLENILETSSLLAEDVKEYLEPIIYSRSLPQRVENKIKKIIPLKTTISSDDVDEKTYTSKKETLSEFDDFEDGCSIISEENISEDVKSLEISEILVPSLDKASFTPSELTISTMTIIASVFDKIIDPGQSINIKYLYDNFEEQKDIFVENTGIIAKFKEDAKNLVIGVNYEGLPPKGYFERHVNKNFYNSLTLNVLYEKMKCINVKVFSNGTLQITGAPTLDAGERVVNIIFDYLKNVPDKENPDKPDKPFKIVPNKSKLQICNFDTVLINTDYSLGFCIERDVLYHLLIHKYGISAHYETDGYPGVKIEYLWNKKTLGTHYEGICKCSKKCVGKGKGKGEFDCKKVTISVFQSGKVIITGGRNLEQIKNAYVFMNKIIRDNYLDIKSHTVMKKQPKIKKMILSTSQFLINKKLITNLQDYDNAFKL